MTNKNNKTLECFAKRLRFLKYADNSVSSYMYYVGLFLDFLDKPKSHITISDAYAFLDECVDDDNGAKNQIISAIKLFYKHVIGKTLDSVKMQRPRKKKQLPRVIDSEILEQKLSEIKNKKHKAILELGYRCGLRVSEVCNVKIEDIDSTRMLILVRDSKFSKDRYVPVSNTLLRVLRVYFKQYRPKEYLFNGQLGGKYSVSSCQKIFKKHIDSSKSFHCLRHSSFTTMLERGVNLHLIQKVAGHSSSTTTERYLHVSNQVLQEAAI